MSTDIVSGNALQFTNDNKRAYAYSGTVGVNNTDVELLSFNTNSEYIEALVTVSSKAGSGDDMNFWIELNEVLISSGYEALVSMPSQNPLPIIIPPFTKFAFYARNLGSTTAREMQVVVVGKVGMPQRVGNLDE